jgi:exonuclease III
MRFGTWNVRSLYRAGLFTAAVRELVRYKLDIVVVQEVRWDREGIIIFSMEKKIRIINWEQDSLYATE